MNQSLLPDHSGGAAAAFSDQALFFDTLYNHDTAILYKRARVRKHLQQYLTPNANILELNAGTGDDAYYLLQQGHRVFATDISEKMLSVLVNKKGENDFEGRLHTQCLSYLQLDQLWDKGPYDCIFSNFAGLNCTDKLADVLQQLPVLLKPGGIITLVILPTFCLWELLLMFRGKFKTAFRRIGARRKGSPAKVNNIPFRCWYYSPAFVTSCLKNTCTLLQVEGLCSIVPPSYIEGFPEKHPFLFRHLSRLEDKYHSRWPWKYIGDYYIISFQKKDDQQADT
jgi:SAM-dependent methyltransferase